MAQLNIDVTNIQPSAGIEPVPAGWYVARIDKSEVKPTKNEDGFFLELVYVIIDGKYTNRQFYSRHNIRNNNPKAQEIAYQELSSIGRAVGVLVIQDSQQLHNIPLKVKLKLKPAEGQYEASNETKAWKHISEEVDLTPQPAAPTFAPPAQAAAPAQQWAPPVAPAAAAQVQQWAPPGGQQPWAAAPAAAPVTTPPAQQAAPAWQQPPAQQQAAPAPTAAPAPAAAQQQAAPPWATQPAAAGAAPAWNSAPQA